MDTTRFTQLEALAARIAGAFEGGRILVAIVGPPASGKSTLVEGLCPLLNHAHHIRCEIVAMDGFHYDNAVLDDQGWRSRKGAPHTFDVGGLASVLGRLKSSPAATVAVPMFDRAADLARASAGIITPEVNIVLVEGNYLLLEDDPWAALRRWFDLSVSIECSRSMLEDRLMDRWRTLGLSEAESRAKVSQNDMKNADTVLTKSVASDLVFASGVSL